MKKFLFLILALCSFSGVVFSDITWSSPVGISTALTDGSNPTIVIDSNGNATAAWIESGLVKASSLPSGGSWGSSVTLSNALNTSVTPKLGVDSSGNVTAAWVENGQVKSAVLPFGGSWGAASSAISGSGTASNLCIAIDASGNAVAIWVRSGFVESSTRISGTWNLVAVLSASNSSNPHIAISSFGTAIAAWHSVVSGADLIVTDILTIGTNTWSSTKNVFSGTAAFYHNYPKVAIDSNGNATIAWFRYNFVGGNSYQNVQLLSSALSVGGAAWGIPTMLSSSGARDPADLSIRLKYDVNGDILAVWTNSYDGEVFNIESSQKIVGGTWPLFISPQSPTLYSFGMDVAVASGTALLVNMAWDGVSDIVILSQETDTTDPVLQAWTLTNPLSTGSDNGYPKCAMSITGSTLNAVVVWTYFNGTNLVINASSGTDSVVAPPSSVSATQSVTNFGVYNDYSNTITWSASTDPDLIQYNIYRNGVFFSQTDASTLQLTDHNQTQGATVIYGVAALRSDFRQSAIVTFTLNP